MSLEPAEQPAIAISNEHWGARSKERVSVCFHLTYPLTVVRLERPCQPPAKELGHARRHATAIVSITQSLQVFTAGWVTENRLLRRRQTQPVAHHDANRCQQLASIAADNGRTKNGVRTLLGIDLGMLYGPPLLTLGLALERSNSFKSKAKVSYGTPATSRASAALHQRPRLQG